MSSLPAKLGHTHNSTRSSSDDCSDGFVENSDVQEYSSELEESGSSGALNHQKANESLQHGEYQQLFNRYVHSKGCKDHQDLKINHPILGLPSEERVENVTCVAAVDMAAAESPNPDGKPGNPSKISYGTPDSDYTCSNPPTPGKYVFTPLSDAFLSPKPTNEDLPISRHIFSPISTLDLDSPTLGWAATKLELELELEKITSSNVLLDPIFTQFKSTGLPTPDQTPTEDCVPLSYPLFAAQECEVTCCWCCYD